ncbi:MAG: helix-turn-helix domain-containing protein [Candidatus Helarchaeota archaeon]
MKFLDSLLENLSAGDLPNKFTLAMGKLIRQAREEMGFSQRELASKIYRRQAALSEMENGKMEPSASTLMSLSYHLNKPISYYFPDQFALEKNLGELTDLEKEIIIYAKQLDRRDQVRILVQLKALSDLE